MEQKVILVDSDDKPLGLMEKMKAHENGGTLHRAISVYIFNSKNQIMMQQRADHKYHSGSLWTNTCCTNCYEGESAEYSAHRSLKVEMGFDCELKEVFSLIYKTEVGEELTEHEFLHVFFGRYDLDPKANPEEVKNWKWMGLEELEKDAEANPNNYTNWLKLLLKGRLHGEIEKFLESSR